MLDSLCSFLFVSFYSFAKRANLRFFRRKSGEEFLSRFDLDDSVRLLVRVGVKGTARGKSVVTGFSAVIKRKGT